MKHFFRRIFIIEHLIILALLLFCGGILAIGLTQKHPNLIIWSLFVLLLLFLFFNMAKEMIRMDPLLHIKEYCEKEGYSLREIEQDFGRAEKTGIRIREGNKWIYFMDQNGHPNLILKDDIVYLEFDSHGKGGSKAYAHNRKDETTLISMSKKSFKKINSHMDKSLMLNAFYRDRINKKVYIHFLCWVFTYLIAIIVLYSLCKSEILVCIILIPIMLIILAIYEKKRKRFTLNNLTEYCKDNGYSMEQLKQEFPSSERITKKVRDSRNWIYFTDANGMPDVIRKEKILFTEQHWRYLYVYDSLNNMKKIPIGKRKAELLDIGR